ncbi:hypothetical protein HII17_07730 [Thalassotalea sp. M1531]|uniref:Uncharacterized protein n=1 Tax=Thalassotalea algicola TaxID=2716224 RepID=A0A7Y0LBG5_9GAMM|nr:hypothetical protein [Thalassotalea algicola]NMP31449.1 hypothetical protein [Thalassotalea algicola]
MKDQIEDNIPSIKPDRDQVEAYRSTKKTSKQSTSTPPDNENQAVASKSSGLGIINSLIIYGAILAGGYWFYQQDVKSTQALMSAEERIVDLERQLSATDEEMGESAVAMRAKLEGLIDKTDKLWSEMDKLWASAWRKNQTQIKELRSKSIKSENKLKNSTTNISANKSAIADLNEKQTAATFSIDALGEQLGQAQNIKSELEILNGKMLTLENKSSGRDKQQIELATMVQELDTSVKMLIERVESLKAKSTPPPAQ